MRWLEELRKNWRLRLSLGMLFMAFLVLVDEAVKEGYVMKLSDLWAAPFTHEQIFVIFLILGLMLGVRS
jgi:hypothetical protein